MRVNFNTLGNLKDISPNELSEREKMAMKKYPHYEIIRTSERYIQGGRAGKVVYEIRDTSDPSLPPVKRGIDSVLDSDVFAPTKKCRVALEKARKNFPDYEFEVIGETNKRRPLYKIKHRDTRLEPIITSFLNDMSRTKEPKDPFRIKYSKYVLLDKARELFPNYIINFHGDDIDLFDSGKIRCLVEYPNNKYGIGSKEKILNQLARGEDPFYYDITISKSLETARILNKNVSIELTGGYIGSKRLCKVSFEHDVTGEIEVEYETLNVLSRGGSPFSNNMWANNSNKNGYFYVLECLSETGKLGVMYGVTVSPYARIISHLNYNKRIKTKTRLLGLFKNKAEESKDIILKLESRVKKKIGMNFFSKEECSTSTETIPVSKLDELITEMERYEIEEEEDVEYMRVISELFKKKGLGDL